MPTLAILADDLTGALDAAAGFTGFGGPVEFVAGQGDRSRIGRIVVDSQTRDVSTDLEAQRRVRALVDVFDGKEIAFKKIDSLMRGHAAAEIAALMDTKLFDSCLVAPAFPEEGRVTQGGQQWLLRHGSSRTPVGENLVHGLKKFGIDAQVVQAGSSWPDLAERQVLVADARTQKELEELCRLAWQRGARFLYCGTTGLARAIALDRPPGCPLPPPPKLLFVGSAHDVSRDQIGVVYAQARRRGIVPAHDTTLSAGCLVADRFGQDRVLVRAGFEGHAPRPIDSQEVATVMRRAARSLPDLNSLTVVGGASLQQVIEAVDAKRLSVKSEIAPGIPAAVVAGGLLNGIVLVSKSGAFGRDTALAQLFLN